jgi:hypothetical protein
MLEASADTDAPEATRLNTNIGQSSDILELPHTKHCAVAVVRGKRGKE